MSWSLTEKIAWLERNYNKDLAQEIADLLTSGYSIYDITISSEIAYRDARNLFCLIESIVVMRAGSYSLQRHADKWKMEVMGNTLTAKPLKR